MYNIAVIGYGYWGPNLVRNIKNHKECSLKYICEINPNLISKAKNDNNLVSVINDYKIILQDHSIDAIFVATPLDTHFELAENILKSKKNLFITKPTVKNCKQIDRLIKLSKLNNLVAVTDHTYIFSSAINKIKEIIESGELGIITYFDSVRVNLGIFQNDLDVVWDLAPHDLSILFYLTDYNPIALTSNGVSHLNNGLVDIAYLTLHYKENFIANFHLNWFSPTKIRKIIIGGSKKMIIFDDLESDEKIRIYDRGIEKLNTSEINKILVEYRFGEIKIPKISNRESLKIEIECFIQQIKKGITNSINDLNNSKKIIKILEKHDISIKNNRKILL